MDDLLVKLGWSKAYFAQHAGVSANTVSNWSKGDPPIIVIKYLELCCRLLNV